MLKCHMREWRAWSSSSRVVFKCVPPAPSPTLPGCFVSWARAKSSSPRTPAVIHLYSPTPPPPITGRRSIWSLPLSSPSLRQICSLFSFFFFFFIHPVVMDHFYGEGRAGSSLAHYGL